MPSWHWQDQSYLKDHPQAPAGLRRAYANDLYAVQWYEHDTAWGRVIHLMVGRHDDQPVRDWKHLQRIKNEIVGPERTAVEVYPPQDEVVDMVGSGEWRDEEPGVVAWRPA